MSDGETTGTVEVPLSESEKPEIADEIHEKFSVTCRRCGGESRVSLSAELRFVAVVFRCLNGCPGAGAVVETSYPGADPS